MGKRNVLVPEIDSVVVALCADYARRAEIISYGCATHRVEMEYKYLNYKIYEAVAEIVGEESAMSVIKDIGNKRGYAKSDADMCETTYKRRKQEVKYAIARKLSLCD